MSITIASAHGSVYIQLMETTTRARKVGQGSKWCRPSTRLALYSRDGFACVCCQATAEDGAVLTLDHVVACELGGTNDPTNLVTMCLSCNSAKQDLTQRAWAKYLREVYAWDAAATTAYLRRVKRQTARKLDRNEGRRLLALRRAA